MLLQVVPCLVHPKVPVFYLFLFFSLLFILGVFKNYFSLKVAYFYVFICVFFSVIILYFYVFVVYVPFGNLKHASFKLAFIRILPNLPSVCLPGILSQILLGGWEKAPILRVLIMQT